jgi:hypothetical protein
LKGGVGRKERQAARYTGVISNNEQGYKTWRGICCLQCARLDSDKAQGKGGEIDEGKGGVQRWCKRRGTTTKKTVGRINIQK